MILYAQIASSNHCQMHSVVLKVAPPNISYVGGRKTLGYYISDIKILDSPFAVYTSGRLLRYCTIWYGGVLAG